MYVDLVLCKHDGDPKPYLFYAPAFEHLKDKEVIVETKHGLAKAVVIDSISIDPTTDNFNFVLKLAGATKPLRKVVSIIRYHELNYNEEMEGVINGLDNDKQ